MASSLLSHLLHLLESILAVVVRLPRALLEYILDWLHFRKLGNRFPGPPPRLLVGNLFDTGLFPSPMSILDWLINDVMHRYPAGQIWMGPKRIFILSDINDIQIFSKNSKNQLKPRIMTDFLSHSLGYGLVTLNGDTWRQHQKIIKPSFHQNLFNKYVAVFNEKSNILIELLSKYANGRAFNIAPMTEAMLLDIVSESFLGLPSNQQLEDHSYFQRLVNETQKDLANRLSKPWLYNDTMYKLFITKNQRPKLFEYLIDLLEKAIAKREQGNDSQEENVLSSEEHSADLDTELKGSLSSIDDLRQAHKPNLIIDALLLAKKNGSISYQELIDELRTAFLAGFDTTLTAIQFALYFLAQYPCVQEKAVSELRGVFEAAGSTEVTIEVLQQMHYMEMILKETLRIHPSIPFFMRETGVDTPLTSCDLIVPAGASVIISPKCVHMNPELYPDPHVFDPDRWLTPEKCGSHHPFAYFPFAAGARSCVGKKFAMTGMKTVLSKIIWNYHIQQDESYKPEFLWGITMVATNGMRIKLRKRETGPGCL